MQSIEKLLAQGLAAERRAKEVYGYDLAEFQNLKISPDKKVTWHFWLHDDFQQNLPYEDQYNHGHLALDHPLFNWPNRERRELEVLIRQTRRITELGDGKLIGLEGQAFVAAIKQDAEKYYTALEDRRIKDEAVVRADAPDQEV